MISNDQKKTLLVSEVLSKVDKARVKKDMIAILQDNNSKALRTVLRGAFDDTIQFRLPKGLPPGVEINEDDKREGTSNIHKHLDKFPYFIQNGPKELSVKTERRFISIIETCSPEEAKVFLWMKDKDMEGKFRGLTKKLVQDAFPGLIKE